MLSRRFQRYVQTSLHRLRDGERWSQQREHTILANRFRERDAVEKLSFRLFALTEKQPALRGIVMNPRATFARVQSLGNHELALRMLESGSVVSGVNAILAEKLPARRLREQHVMLLAKRDRAPRPAIRLVVKTVVLITARRVRVNLRDHRPGKSADTVAVRSRRDELLGAQQQFDRLLVTPGEMMKARFSRKRVGGFERIRYRIQNPQSLVQILAATRIAIRDQRSGSLTL